MWYKYRRSETVRLTHAHEVENFYSLFLYSFDCHCFLVLFVPSSLTYWDYILYHSQTFVM